MARIVFSNGYSLENLPKAKVRRLIDQEALIAELVELRQSWQQDYDNLIEVQASVGLLFVDLAGILAKMGVEGADRVLGDELKAQAADELSKPITVKAEAWQPLSQ